MDVAAALTVAERLGCDAAAAVDLVMAVNDGLCAGWRKRREAERTEDV